MKDEEWRDMRDERERERETEREREMILPSSIERRRNEISGDFSTTIYLWPAGCCWLGLPY
jgi:hypothetical protein